MAWYRANTVAVTNGSAVVTGTGTAFVANVQPGHAFNAPDGKVYEIAAVNSDTVLTLGSPYLGSTATGQSYSVQPNQGFAQQAATMLATFIAQYAGYVSTVLSGKFADGTVAAPGVTFSADQDTGFYRVSSDAIGVACGGVQSGIFASTGVSFSVPLTIGTLTATGNLIGGGLQVNAGGFMQHYVSGAAANQKYSRNYAASGGLYFDFANDTLGAASNWLIVGRSGTSATSINFGSGLYPLVDNAYPCGGPSVRWSVVCAASGTINTSDARIKTKPKPFDDKLLDAWAGVEWVQFQFLASVAEKGADKARIHWGVIAQQVRDALAAGGIDGLRYGVLCYDKWEAQAEVRQAFQPGVAAVQGVPSKVDDESGAVLEWMVRPVAAMDPVPEVILTPARAAGELWGIRYDLAQAIEAAFQRRRADHLDARLTALEAKLAA